MERGLQTGAKKELRARLEGGEPRSQGQLSWDRELGELAGLRGSSGRALLTSVFRTAGACVGPGRLQSTGPSEPGAFKPPPKPVIVDKRRPPLQERGR